MTQRTWFITGVSSGFGRELASSSSRGDRVVGTVRRPGRGRRPAGRYPETFRVESST